MYYVKTRNWHCKKWLLPILSIFGKRADSYDDGDGKLYFETNWLILGLLVLAYWKLFSKISGGWTYIANEKKYPYGLPDSKKSLYL